MISPMMVITTGISMSVKPRSPSRPAVAHPRRDIGLPAPIDPNITRMTARLIILRIVSHYQLRHREQCRHDRDDQAANHDADRQDGDGSDDPHRPIEAALQLCLVEFRNPACK